MTNTKPRWRGTVVARLEIALVAVVLSILVAAFLSGRQMLELRRVETDVFARALPALQTAQSLGGDLTALLGLTTVMTHDLPDDRLADLNQTMQGDNRAASDFYAGKFCPSPAARNPCRNPGAAGFDHQPCRRNICRSDPTQ